MTSLWIPTETWTRTPHEGATHYDIITDPALGTIAYTTAPDGTIITGSNTAYREG